MNTRLRIASIRVYEKCQKNPNLANELGIETTMNSMNEIIRETKATHRTIDQEITHTTKSHKCLTI